MAWGYGRVGYGPFRVRRVLDAAPNVGVQLRAAAGAAAEGRPVEAYACLGDHGAARLPYLGPAFGTKFLYCCSSTGTRPVLILDRLMARWLRENVGLAFNEVRWSVSTYKRCLETMVNWADELALAADQLEVCIFSTQARLGDTQSASADHAANRVTAQAGNRPGAQRLRLLCVTGFPVSHILGWRSSRFLIDRVAWPKSLACPQRSTLSAACA
jgi:hypothetical protein